ncbi:MAG: hypothetical protein HRT67_02295 [Flavobacteriaceae bacterium]|nr:hypothetical protein [Flavobacteriaceae bacterium]
MKSLPNFDELIAEANTCGLYENLIHQLNKDLLYANVDLEFDSEILPQSLKYMLQDTVYQLINTCFAEYLSLLYIIDVPEHKVKQLDGSNAFKLSEQVTFLILLREWQKVWYKSQYS